MRTLQSNKNLKLSLLTIIQHFSVCKKIGGNAHDTEKRACSVLTREMSMYNREASVPPTCSRWWWRWQAQWRQKQPRQRLYPASRMPPGFSTSLQTRVTENSHQMLLRSRTEQCNTSSSTSHLSKAVCRSHQNSVIVFSSLKGSSLLREIKTNKSKTLILSSQGTDNQHILLQSLKQTST